MTSYAHFKKGYENLMSFKSGLSNSQIHFFSIRRIKDQHVKVAKLYRGRAYPYTLINGTMQIVIGS